MSPPVRKILFFGMDDAGKLKSLKVPFGYPGVLWFEELDQFEEEQVRSVEQSVLRGAGPFYCFKTFNPPPFRTALGQPVGKVVPEGRQVHHSDYTQMPVGWLGEKFLDDARFWKGRILGQTDRNIWESRQGWGTIYSTTSPRSLSTMGKSGDLTGYWPEWTGDSIPIRGRLTVFIL